MARIVVGVDGSPNSVAALRWAIDEARHRGAQLDAVCAWEYPYTADLGLALATGADLAHFERQAAASLAAAIAEACPDGTGEAHVNALVVEDAPAHALLEAAEGADLLVVGARGRGGFRGLLLGSVSSQVVRHARGAVVVVPLAAAR